MLEFLPNVLSRKIIFTLSKAETEDSSSIIIREDGVSSEIKELTIKEIPDNSVAFTLDFSEKKSSDTEKSYFSQLSPYFDKGNGCGINKSCDLVIITQSNEKFIILIFDQKSRSPDLDLANIQLENSKIFITYIISLIRFFYNEDIREENLVFKKAIGTTRPVKRGTNTSSNQNEIERRNKLRQLGLNEITIKRTVSPEKGWLDYRGIVSY
ncbi:hypothetical protein [Pectobacterium odoriferum]|uniref:hypothetical protein n=1 Tax=Pectobacterium odoriferum TaxID=78398 RepID=UPI000CD0B15E|nr:hypothetical protein [Pectobacterium odoriferum]POE38582.1 hypothetical protein BV920_16490 [Pectobacterium odoriferum]